ncbi:MAG: hypothetical protein JWR02_2398 [Mucilaginibacter sp.]|nr:hypothetical protein [Mucilaginibacter sp.]
MKKYFFLLAFLTTGTSLMAQKADSIKTNNSADSLLNSMNNDDKNAPVVIFKASRLVLSQSSETVKKNNLNFLIIHRFGDFAGKNGGGQIFFGLDAVADVYLGFEYGLTDNLNIDIGRTTIGGLADLELKYALLHQTGDNSSPLAITLIGEAGVRPYGSFVSTGDRVSYFAQAIFARKFSSDFSLQVAPSLVQNNTPIPLVPGSEQQFFALSAAGRLKVSKHMGIIVDYAHSFSSFHTGANDFSDPLGVGLEMITGGHVFTVNITNSRAIQEINYLSNTQSDFSRGQYRIGFTISRMFDFNHKETHKAEK